MLKVIVPASEQYDSRTRMFQTKKAVPLSLEHSLVSISKWEAKWNKPFLSRDEKTAEEILDYIRCMTTTQNVDPEVYKRIPVKLVNEIMAYVNAPMTATTFREDSKKSRSREIVTSELIYYWMFANGIDKECEKWHFNRLMTLIRIFGVKNGPDKKMSKKEIMARNAQLNAARRAKLNSKG